MTGTVKATILGKFGGFDAFVGTDDLDLARPAGQRSLSTRLRSAERAISYRGPCGAEVASAQSRCMRSIVYRTISPG